jgi:hypothetical protein
MSVVSFRSRIAINGINPFVRVSAVMAARLKRGWRRPLPVCVRVNGKPQVPWRINLMPAGNGAFYLYLHGTVRKASGSQVGDFVHVELEFDAAYRNGPMHPVPSWFSRALNDAPRAKRAWDHLIPSRKKEVLRYFAQLKSPQAQARNLQRAMQVLSGVRGRFMARSWN